MQTPNPAGILTEKQRAGAVLSMAAGSPLCGIAARSGCTLTQLQQEMRHNPQFAWQMEHAKELIASHAFLYIVRHAATQPAAAKWLQKHLKEGVPLIDFVLNSLFPHAPATSL